MKNAGEGAEIYAKAKEFARKCGARIINKVVRFANKPITQSEPESAVDRAARRTAMATVWIAIFTVVLAAVGYLQYREIRDSGVESGGQMDRMIHEYRSQVAQMNRQAVETHDLAISAGKQADRTKQLADQAVRQTAAAQVAANAAKDAAQTAKDALHISERAYLSFGVPRNEFQNHVINVPVINSGHIPSGAVTFTVHEVTFIPQPVAEVDGFTIDSRYIVERHWGDLKIEKLPQGSPLDVGVTLPKADANLLVQGKEAVAFFIDVIYNDGFEGKTDTWSMCAQPTFDSSAGGKLKDMIPCTNQSYMRSVLLRVDEYPSPKYQATNQPN